MPPNNTQRFSLLGDLTGITRPKPPSPSSSSSSLASTATATTLTARKKKELTKKAEQYIKANVKLIAACQDEQQTMDCSNVVQRFGLRQSKRSITAKTNDGGAATSVLLKLLYGYANNPEDNGVPTYAKLLTQMRGLLRARGYPQVPALTSSRPITLSDEFHIMPTTTPFTGTRRALIIGINYTGNGKFEIPGCHNDCHNMMEYLKRMHGFQDDDFTILMDDGIHTSPTRDNITKAFHRFAWSVKPGDAVFFHYAGHGSTQADESGDEESGLDSTMLPVDFLTKGVIVDDEIFRILLVPLPKGVDMTAIVDCCHSGTIFDLPFEYIGDPQTSDDSVAMYDEDAALANVKFPHWNLVQAEQRRKLCMTALRKRASQIELACMEPAKQPLEIAMQPLEMLKRKTDSRHKKDSKKKKSKRKSSSSSSGHRSSSSGRKSTSSSSGRRSSSSSRKPSSSRSSRPPSARNNNNENDESSTFTNNTRISRKSAPGLIPTQTNQPPPQEQQKQRDMRHSHHDHRHHNKQQQPGQPKRHNSLPVDSGNSRHKSKSKRARPGLDPDGMLLDTTSSIHSAPTIPSVPPTSTANPTPPVPTPAPAPAPRKRRGGLEPSGLQSCYFDSYAIMNDTNDDNANLTMNSRPKQQQQQQQGLSTIRNRIISFGGVPESPPSEIGNNAIIVQKDNNNNNVPSPNNDVRDISLRPGANKNKNKTITTTQQQPEVRDISRRPGAKKKKSDGEGSSKKSGLGSTLKRLNPAKLFKSKQ